jgi:predicted nucleic acid-binding protein
MERGGRIRLILADTGPLVALGDENDAHRVQVEETLANKREPMLTTEACLTEALYLLDRAGGWVAQDVLWTMLRTGVLTVHLALEAPPLRAYSYMERFRDQPCDYADATLLVAAEDTGLRRIVTIDRHFHAYRLASGESLEVLA